MALTSETQPSPNGVNCFEHESVDVLNEEDLEDGEIFEDEEPSNDKAPVVSQEKMEVSQSAAVPTIQEKPSEPVKVPRTTEDQEKPLREQRVPFFNKGKRKQNFDDVDDTRWKRDGKRNRRSHEFEREGESNRMRNDGEDDEEMMFVRGASPHRQGDEDKWDREGEEEDTREINRRPTRSFRGRGGLSRRGDRLRGRGRGRGSLRGSKRKRDDRDGELCIFFQQGKCHRGSECPYAHEILPPRKMELCKFYMKDCCNKNDKCLYMHSEFPCKYFHKGLKCYANKKCKFSHAPLNDALRNLLAKHLDAAPKDILGEFSHRDRDQRDRGDMRGESRNMRGDPRDMRDMRGEPRDMRGDPRDMRGDSRDMRDSRDTRDFRDTRVDFVRNKHDRDRKIPSLFDIKVTIPDDMRNSDGNHTPMPSPTQRSQDSTKSSDRDRDNYSPDREREKEREKEREHDRLKHEKAERSKERKAKREKAREHRKERKERKEREKEKKRERSKDAISEKNELLENERSEKSIMSPTQTENSTKMIADVPLPPLEKTAEEQDKKGLSCEVNGMFPQHLPKKQQELFLRIQQQQREAESSQASANDEDEEDAAAAEENWYSSDEETPNPVPVPPVSAAPPPTSTPSTMPVMPLLNLLASASAAAKPLTVTNTQPSTASFIPPNLDLSNLSTVFEALTNLQKMACLPAATTAEPQQSLTATAALQTTTAFVNKEAAIELPKTEPSANKPEPPRVRDPRLRIDGAPVDSLRLSVEGLDVDLRPKPPAKMPSPQSSTDVDLRNLPFKAVSHAAASEIDASLTSHNPLPWLLVPVDGIKADYASLNIQPKPGVTDPRLRRVVQPATNELGLPRDPRQRLADEPARDPRPRPALLATPLLVPPSPRYDEDHRPQFYRMDSDMRQFPPATPRPDEEVYTPGPSRPVDPRRVKAVEDPRRTFPGRPDDIDLRPQMNHRVPYVNFK